MRPRSSRRAGFLLVAATALAAVAAVAAACQAAGPTAAPTATPTDEPAVDGRTSSLCPPVGGPIGEAVTKQAIEVLEHRLEQLGVEGATFRPGTCIDVELPTEITDPAVAAVLQRTGQVALLAVPADRIGSVLAGGPAPPDAEVLAAGHDFAAAGSEPDESGREDLRLDLATAAASSVASWTAANADGALALSVDGVVAAVLPVGGSPSRGPLRFEIPAFLGLPAPAIVALLASGPLPEEWAQPQDPQG